MSPESSNAERVDRKKNVEVRQAIMDARNMDEILDALDNSSDDHIYHEEGASNTVAVARQLAEAYKSAIERNDTAALYTFSDMGLPEYLKEKIREVTNSTEQVQSTESMEERHTRIFEAMKTAQSREELASLVEQLGDKEGMFMSDSASGRISATRAAESIRSGNGANVSDSRIQAAAIRLG